jgi:hypothetical protein
MTVTTQLDLRLLMQGGYGEPSLNGYFTKLSEAFKKFIAGTSSSSSSGTSRYIPTILFDGANGVGAQAMQEFVRRLEGVLNVTMFNTGTGTGTYYCYSDRTSVAEPEPVERPLFGGAGAQVFRPGSGSGNVNL